MSRLRAGEPRGPAGRRGARPLPFPPRRPPRGAARREVPRGAAAAAAAARGAGGGGGGAEGRAGGALPERRRCAPCAAVRLARGAGHTGCCFSVLQAGHFLIQFFCVLRFVRGSFQRPYGPPPPRAAGDGRVGARYSHAGRREAGFPGLARVGGGASLPTTGLPGPVPCDTRHRAFLSGTFAPVPFIALTFLPSPAPLLLGRLKRKTSLAPYPIPPVRIRQILILIVIRLTVPVERFS